MAQLVVGVTWTKAQINSKAPPTVVYTGYSLSACKTAIQTPIDAGTASKGTILSQSILKTTRRNPAGT
jgi:hypothetical protein